MPTDIESLRSVFVKIYAAVPAKLREEIIALAEDKPYNWNSAYIEIINKTKTGNQLLQNLEKTGLIKPEKSE